MRWSTHQRGPEVLGVMGFATLVVAAMPAKLENTWHLARTVRPAGLVQTRWIA